jgi:hypothetical protein
MTSLPKKTFPGKPSNPPPPEDQPYPVRGDTEGWRAWWIYHNAAWGAYWRATGRSPAAGIFGEPDTRLSLDKLTALPPPEFAARMLELRPSERRRIRAALGIPEAANEEELLRLVRGLEESPEFAQAITQILADAAEGGAA